MLLCGHCYSRVASRFTIVALLLLQLVRMILEDADAELAFRILLCVPCHVVQVRQ
jgi:hypothetical protein